MLKKYFKFKVDYLIWVTTLIFLVLFHFIHPLDNDEGVTLEGALNIFKQREIYKDFFEFVTPGVFYTIAFFWKIFGISYLIAKASVVAALLISIIGTYKISQKVSNKKSNDISPLILVLTSAAWPIISYHTFNLAFMVWAMFFLLKWLDLRKDIYLIISGLLTGFSILFMQNKGLLLMGALSSFLLILSIKDKYYFKKSLWYLLGAFFPLLLLLSKWSPIFLYQKLILFPIQNYTKLPNLSYELLIVFILWILTIVVLLVKEKNNKILLLIYTQIILIFSVNSLPDIFHISLILFPSYALINLSLDKIKNKKLYEKIIFYILIFIGIAVSIIPAVLWNKAYSPFLDSSKNNIFLEYIKNNCSASQYIYAGPFFSSIYFETRLQNPTSFSWLITKHHSEEQFVTAAKQLSENRPLCAVLDYSSVKKYNYNKDNPVDNYILNNYYQINNFGNILIYKINDLPTSPTK